MPASPAILTTRLPTSLHSALKCLENLRELKIDSNAISDLTPLFDMRGLIKLSAAGNTLRSMDFKNADWSVPLSLPPL
jgi:Leucine-rich repeat (LRR) protein